jgi:hypothetical protein
VALKSRKARPDDLTMLQADLAKDKRWEQLNLRQGIAFIVEKDGEPVVFTAARLVWQQEPLKFLHGKRKKLTPLEQTKAVFLAAKALQDWLSDPKNNPYVKLMFTSIRNKKMQRYAKRKPFNMTEIYKGNKFYGKDL